MLPGGRLGGRRRIGFRGWPCADATRNPPNRLRSGSVGQDWVDLFGGIAPRLRKLKLYHIGLKKWNSPLLFNLKELSLISTPGPTMTELLSILEASSDLESLEVFLRHIDGITPASTPSHSVSLLRLSKLNVLSPNPAISNRFLHSIKAPSCCYSTIQFVGQAQDLAICPECVSVPFRSFLITAEEVNLLIHSASLEPSFFLIRGKEKDQSLFRLEWHGLTLHSIGSTLFPTLFPESPTVQISLDLQSTDNLDVLLEESSVWTLSGVKKIKWAGERLVRALMYAKVVDGQPRWLWPRLDYLGVHGVAGEMVLRMLEARAVATMVEGVSDEQQYKPVPLGHLVMDHSCKVSSTLLEDIRSVVGDVVLQSR
ncbi:hypothetical protein FRB94_005044 [Tulasnella sp. JGI-2019a]|nr:hypothetical protein FRB94_005044 [Tulasnella sp. JGI-2019a]